MSIDLSLVADIDPETSALLVAPRMFDPDKSFSACAGVQQLDFCYGSNIGCYSIIVRYKYRISQVRISERN